MKMFALKEDDKHCVGSLLYYFFTEHFKNNNVKNITLQKRKDSWKRNTTSHQNVKS